eukprot:3713973-Amphidinium_carterae.1
MTDSSSAQAIAKRRGVARIRHLHTPLLWLQTRVTRGEVRVMKVPGKDNISDIATKAVDAQTMHRHLETA